VTAPDVTEGAYPAIDRDDADWIDAASYPFESNYADLSDGRMHYLDEGPDDPERTLVFLHGVPTWSYLYRHLVREFRTDYRCVVPDLLGFGLSEQPDPETFSYGPSDQYAALVEFFESLDLEAFALVVHGWGGSLGIPYAFECPEAIEAVVATNTAAWPRGHSTGARLWSRVAGGPVGRALGERFDPLVRGMGLAYADRSKFTPTVRRHYLGPFEGRSTQAPHRLVRSYGLGDTEWVQTHWERRRRRPSVPTRIVWGMDDPAVGGWNLRVLEALFEHADVLRCRGVGHFVPEELGLDLVDHLDEFLAPE
jgi:haloalkane dehalogenase